MGKSYTECVKSVHEFLLRLNLLRRQRGQRHLISGPGSLVNFNFLVELPSWKNLGDLRIVLVQRLHSLDWRKYWTRASGEHGLVMLELFPKMEATHDIEKLRYAMVLYDRDPTTQAKRADAEFDGHFRCVVKKTGGKDANLGNGLIGDLEFQRNALISDLLHQGSSRGLTADFDLSELPNSIRAKIQADHVELVQQLANQGKVGVDGTPI